MLGLILEWPICHWWSMMIRDDQRWSEMIRDDQWWSMMISDDQRWSEVCQSFLVTVVTSDGHLTLWCVPQVWATAYLCQRSSVFRRKRRKPDGEKTAAGGRSERRRGRTAGRASQVSWYLSRWAATCPGGGLHRWAGPTINDYLMIQL